MVGPFSGLCARAHKQQIKNPREAATLQPGGYRSVAGRKFSSNWCPNWSLSLPRPRMTFSDPQRCPPQRCPPLQPAVRKAAGPTGQALRPPPRPRGKNTSQASGVVPALPCCGTLECHFISVLLGCFCLSKGVFILLGLLL